MYKLITWTWQQFAKLMDKIFRGNGEFSEWMTQEEMGFSKEEGNKYQPSSGIIKHVFRKLPIGNGDSIIDIGCGRGRAMYMISKFPFDKIDGYDLSEKMVACANDNFKKVCIDDRCRAFQANALDYKDYDSYNYFYAFNPVPEKMFEIMMDNISENIKQRPRKCTFIYLNPVCNDYIVKNTPFKLYYKKKGIVHWNDVYVYKHE